MALDYELVAEGTDVDVTNAYYVYLRRDTDSLYFDSDDSTFKSFGTLVDGQLELSEDADQPGLWQISISVPAGETGAFSIIPRDEDDLIVVDGFARVYLVDGEPVRSLVDAEVFLSDQYGGVDDYRLIDESGDPVDGATVRIFDKASYDASDLDAPIGVTFTDSTGRWLDPVPVTPGDTYVVVFHKEGLIGPTSVEIIVPA